MIISNHKSGHEPRELPRYQQVKAHILGRIQSGELRACDRVPSEQELVRSLGVSRMTAHRALRELAGDGYLVRQPGVGTFVADHARSHLLEVHNIADEIRRRGFSHSATVMTLEALKAGEEIADKLHMPNGSKVFHSLIVHRENGQPIQVENRFVRPAAAPAYLDQDFSVITPNAYLSAAAPLQTVEHTIRAVAPGNRVRRLLNMEPSEPGLLIYRRTWSGGRPVSIAYLHHPGHRYELTGSFNP